MSPWVADTCPQEKGWVSPSLICISKSSLLSVRYAKILSLFSQLLKIWKIKLIYHNWFNNSCYDWTRSDFFFFFLFLSDNLELGNICMLVYRAGWWQQEKTSGSIMKFNMIRVVRYKHQLCFFIEEPNGNMQLFSKALKFIKLRKKKYSPMNIV